MRQFTGIRPSRKPAQFRKPPWTVDSEEWQRCDRDISADHIARRIVAAIALVDLTPLAASYSASGSAPYPPELMLAVVFIEKYRGRHRPSQWFQDVQENLVLQWAGRGIRPARSVWYEFRDRLSRGGLLDDLFQQTLTRALDAGLTDASQGAMDGSTVASSASRHKLLNAERLDRRIETLNAACARDQAPPTDPPDPAAAPREKNAWMAKTAAGREEQRDRYRRARESLTARLEQNARRIPSERQPEKQIVVSPSDPEAALGPDKFKTFRPLFNVLTVPDMNSRLILSWDVYARSQDTALLKPMLDRTRMFVGDRLKDLAVDSGFVTGVNLAQADQYGVSLFGPWKENDFSARRKTAGRTPSMFSKDEFTWQPGEQTYVCPAGHRLKRLGRERRVRAGDQEETLTRFACAAETCAGCPLREQCTTSKHGRQLRRSEHEDLIAAHRAKMKTPAAKAVSKQRGQNAELNFADMKEHRGIRRFSGRGMSAARADVGLTLILHNLLVVHDHLQSSTETNPPNP